MRRDLTAFRKILSAGALGLALFPWSCHRKPIASAPPPPVPVPTPTPAPAPTPAPIPASIPQLPPGPSYFELGEEYFRNGDYAKAAQAYEIYVRDDSSPNNQDQALFRLALSHAFPESPVRNMPQAVSLLQQLVKRFPQSPFKPQAEYLLSLQGEAEKLRTDVSKRDDRIKELTLELEKLKQIDMQRRRTVNPP
jgi:tetratricopeptide (TPR) repeat protein